MIRNAKYTRRATAAAATFLALVTLSACGGGGAALLFSGGGIGGTGFSTGAIVAFGSVVVNGVEFFTDNAVSPSFVTTKLVDGTDSSSGRDNSVFQVGMVVRVRHGSGDNNAVEIDYDGNVEGPIDAINLADNTVTVMGQPCRVDGATRFNPGTLSFASLAVNNVLEVSGLPDGTGRIRATYIEVKRAAPQPGETFKIRGYVSAIGGGAFGLGPLPGISVLTVDFSAVPPSNLPSGGVADGQFVEVKTTQRTAPGPVLALDAASRIDGKSSEFQAPEGASVSFEGFPANIDATAQSFDLNGVPVSASASTAYADSVPGGTRNSFAGVTATTRLQAEGAISGGVLHAEKIVFK